MSDAKHTPGPWFVGAQNDCLFVTNWEPPRGDYDRELRPICKVGPDPTDEANARLIAAAPSLLQQLRKDAWVLESYAEILEGSAAGIARELAACAAGVRATIAKATGGPSDA